LEIIVAPRGKVPPEYGPDTATSRAALTNKRQNTTTYEE